MGIRIHKILGWGLDDVQNKDYDIIDSRFNPLWSANTIEGEEFRETLFDFIDGFIKWLSENEKEANDLCIVANGSDKCNLIGVRFLLQEFLKRPEVISAAYQVIIYSGEYGLPNVFLVRPIEEPRWARFDDTIDYYEADIDQPNKLMRLDHRCGIYPFCGIVKIPNTPSPPERLQHLLKDYDINTGIISPPVFNQLTGRWSEDLPIPDKEVAQFLLDNYRPIIPESVLLITRYLNIFTNWEETVQQLRPMLYTYWG